MARRGASGLRRIEINRAAVDEVTLAMADGLVELAWAIVSGANVPDAPPYGVGLREGGAVLAYVGRKRVGIRTTGGQTAVTKPRGVRLSDSGITVVGGYGFPARFQEEGTTEQSARPFLTPRLMAELEAAIEYLRTAAKRHNIGEPSR